MGLDAEPVCVRDLVLEPLDVGAQELENRPALGAYHVVVVGVAKLVLETRQPVLELDRTRELGIDEDLERTIDRRSTDAGMVSTNDPVEIIHGHVATGLEEVLEDDLALTRMLEPVRGQVVGEHPELLLSFRHDHSRR